MRYLVTGGAGFIGSNFIRYIFNKYGDDAQVAETDVRPGGPMRRGRR